MDWLSALVSGGASGGLGLITGAIGGAFKAWGDYRMAKLRAQEKKDDQQHELAVMDKEAAIAKDMAQIAMEEKTMLADTQALIESSRNQDTEVSWGQNVMDRAGKWTTGLAAFVLTFITFVQKTIRPGLTIYLMVIVHRMWEKVAGDAFWAALTTDQKMSIAISIVNFLLWAAGTALAWWFMTRPPKWLKETLKR
jgi:hypothetical protein